MPTTIRNVQDAATAGQAEETDHDSWFRQQVAQAIAQADRSDAVWTSQAEVEAEWERERSDLLQDSERVDDGA